MSKGKVHYKIVNNQDMYLDEWLIACDSKPIETLKAVRNTSKVSCGNCRRTEAFKEAKK